MTACRQWKDRLLDYVLGVLCASVVSEVESHLKACPNCSATLLDLRHRRDQLDAALAELVRGAEPSPAMRARVLAAVEAGPAPALWRPAWAGVLAAVAVILWVGFSLPLPRLRDWAAAPSGRAFRASPPSNSVSLSTWRSPTESLLRSPTDELLKAPPRLGEFYFPLQPAPPRTDTKKGGNNES